MYGYKRSLSLGLLALLASACSLDDWSSPTSPGGPGSYCSGTSGSNCGFPWASITPREDTLFVGDTVRLHAAYHDATDRVIPGVAFYWQSGDTTIVRVDQAGLVQAVRPGWVFVVAVAREPNGTEYRSGYAHLWVF